MDRIGRGMFWALAVAVLATPTARADERADWGVVVAVGTEDSTLLLQADRVFRLVAVDPLGTIRGPRLHPLTLTDIRPGDRVDYAWSPWARTAVADLVHVTPRHLLGGERARTAEAPRRPADLPARYAGDGVGITFLK